MALDSFYQTAAQICFTLLGLWWLVLQAKYAQWIGAPAQRRSASNISLYFLLPGAMSLLALAAQTRLIWQVAFVIASGIGIVETALLVRRTTGAPRLPRVAMALRGAGLVCYALLMLTALFPQLPAHFGLAPLTVASMLLTLLIVFGVTLAWRYFAEPLPASA
ncbi:MAG: hypothetical protein ACHQ4H_17195 [Ktedonobacterales bacterium]